MKNGFKGRAKKDGEREKRERWRKRERSVVDNGFLVAQDCDSLGVTADQLLLVCGRV